MKRNWLGRLEYRFGDWAFPQLALFIVAMNGAVYILSMAKPEFYAMLHLDPRLVLSGQVWRLFTPMFIHFGLIHLLFNMLWLKDLGSAIERRHGIVKFIAMVLVISALSNLGQYLVAGPSFGGMSGVVFGLLGYIWMRGKFDPSSGFRLPKSIVIMMGIWFIICFVGIIPGIANTAHAVGLGLGMLFGFVSSGRLGKLFDRSG